MNQDINTVMPFMPLASPVAVSRPATPRENKPNFVNLLQNELAGGGKIRFSAHAEKRLKERGIVLAREELVRIEQAVRQVAAKGARESLIIYGDLALITCVKNKTVVTAIDANSFNDHVFTNIDSAVIVR